MPIARDARARIHDRVAAADQSIEQRRLADIGAPDDGNGGGAARHPCPSPNAEVGSGNAERKVDVSVPSSAFRVPSSVNTSTKSYDRRTGIAARTLKSAAITSSMESSL